MIFLFIVLGILSICFLFVMLVFYYDFMSEFSPNEIKYKISFKQFYEWYQKNKKKKKKKKNRNIYIYISLFY